MKNKITKTEKLQLTGLLALADKHYDTLIDIERACCEVLDTPSPPTDSGHIGDMIWGTIGHNDVDEMLRKMGVEVVDDTPEEEKEEE